MYGLFRNLKPLTVLSAIAIVQSISGTSQAAFNQQLCSEDWSASVPTDFGASEFDKDLNTAGNYGKNESFSWSAQVSGNALWMNPHLLNFNTESGYDFLQVAAGSAGQVLTNFTGNLGTQWFNTKFSPTSNAVYPLQWKSDVSVTLPASPRFDMMRFQCLPAAQQTTTAPVHTIQPNQRYDGVLFNDADILYFMVEQQSNTAMVVSLDVDAADAYADFDLYVSTSVTRPDDTNFTYRGYHGGGGVENAGELIVVPSFQNIDNRPLYIGVRNFSGHGHFSLRANRVPTDRRLTICTQDMTPAQVMANPGWPNAKETLQRTLARVFQATEGNDWIDNVSMKLQAGGIQGPGTQYFCENDASCDWCMTAYGISTNGFDGCGYQGNGGGRMRIPNVRCQGAEADPYHGARNYGNPEYLSKVLLHESGHALGRMITHQDVGTMLPDEYRNNGAQTAHSVMNGPVDQLDTGYRFSTDFNFCPINDPQASPECPPSSDWKRIRDSGRANNWIFPSASQSAQPWLRFQANVWARTFININAI